MFPVVPDSNHYVKERRGLAAFAPEGGKTVRVGKWCVRSVCGSSGRIKQIAPPPPPATLTFRKNTHLESSDYRWHVAVPQLTCLQARSSQSRGFNGKVCRRRACGEMWERACYVRNSHVDRLHAASGWDAAQQVEMEFKILPVSCQLLHSLDPSSVQDKEWVGPRVVLTSLPWTPPSSLALFQWGDSGHTLKTPQAWEHRHSQSPPPQQFPPGRCQARGSGH